MSVAWMGQLRIPVLTGLALLAFAGNSLLCRLALTTTGIDPASFTGIRLLSGAAVLYLLLRLRRTRRVGAGGWWPALCLTAYAVAFAYAYVGLSAATGALLLFGAVQVSMISVGLLQGERFRPAQLAGLATAIIGLVVLLLPGLAAPPLGHALLMMVAGLAWAGYSLLGRTMTNPLAATAESFVRSLPLALVLLIVAAPWLHWDPRGAGYALASGALTSGIGYAIWYAALPHLRASTAATAQLGVPAITALGGVLLLAEPMSLRLLLASMAILGGVGLVIAHRRHAPQPPSSLSPPDRKAR